MKKEKEKERIYKVDNIKAILIFLVVFAHCLYSYNHINSSIIKNIVFLIYSFHMPIFLIISGFLSKKVIKKDKLMNLFILFFIMNISFYLYDFIVYNDIKLPIIRYSAWYLLDLLIYRYIYSKTEINKNFLIIILGLGLLIPFIPNLGDYLNLYRGIYYFFFFLLGTTFDISNLNKILKNSNKFVIAIGTIIVSILSIFIINNYGFNLSFFTVAYYNNVLEFFFRIVFLGLTILMLYSFILFVPNKKVPMITNIGKNSLNIYFFHRIITLIFNEYFYNNPYFIILSFVVSLIICILFSLNMFDYVIKILKKIFNNIFSWILLIILLLFIIYNVLINNYKKDNYNLNPIYDIISDSEIQKLNENSFTIGFVGDLILLEDQVKNSYNEEGYYDFNYMFKYTNKYFSSVDYMIGIFEGPSDDSKEYSVSNFNDGKKLRLNYPSNFIKNIKDNGFDIVSISNNHLLDAGLTGAYATIDNLNINELDYVGGYKNKKDNVPKIVDIENAKVGILTYTYGLNYHTEDEIFNEYYNVTNYLCSSDSENLLLVKEKIDNDFKYLKDNKVDFIIVIPHMGTQFIHNQDEYQNYWNNYFASKGANLVLGDHSHAVQPLEYINDTLIINSPGNYNNTYIENDGDLSMMVKVYIDKETLKINGASIIPFYTLKLNDKGFTTISIYDAINNPDIYNNLSNLDLLRIEEGIKIITKSALGESLSIDQLQDEYYYFKSGYKRQNVKGLNLTEEEKNSDVYQKLNSSKVTCFIGDSITEGTKNGGYPWYEPLINELNTEAINISKGGYTSSDIINQFKDKIENSSCDLFVIAIGTNDIRYNSLEVSKYLNNLDKIISYTNNNVIVISPWRPLENDFKNYDNYENKIKIYDEYEQELETYCKNKDILFVNPNIFINDTLKYELISKYYLDGIHPNSNYGIKLYSRSVLH